MPVNIYYFDGSGPGKTDTGQTSPSTVISDDTTGQTPADIVWTNPENSTTSNDLYATSYTSIAETGFTQTLKATNFGLSIPLTATVTGIEVGIERKGTKGDPKDIKLNIVKSDGTYGSENKAKAENYPTTDTYATYGGDGDLWGEEWPPSDINDVDFGVGLVCGTSTANNGGISVDHIYMKVFYTDDSISGISDPDDVWINDANAFDGNDTTIADAVAIEGEDSSGSKTSNYLSGIGTTTPSSGGEITQVRVRLKSYVDTGEMFLTVFSSSEELGTVGGGTTPPGGSFSDWNTLLVPSGGWTWDKLQNLEARNYHNDFGAFFEYVVFINELEVTSDPAGEGDLTGVQSIAGISTIQL